MRLMQHRTVAAATRGPVGGRGWRRGPITCARSMSCSACSMGPEPRGGVAVRSGGAPGAKGA